MSLSGRASLTVVPLAWLPLTVLSTLSMANVENVCITLQSNTLCRLQPVYTPQIVSILVHGVLSCLYRVQTVLQNIQSVCHALEHSYVRLQICCRIVPQAHSTQNASKLDNMFVIRRPPSWNYLLQHELTRCMGRAACCRAGPIPIGCTLTYTLP